MAGLPKTEIYNLIEQMQEGGEKRFVVSSVYKQHSVL